MDVLRGQIVKSKAGRDKGDLFIVLRVEGEYVYMANGDGRKVDTPKRKKLKHLQLTETVSEFVSNKLSQTDKVTNNEVRIALAEYLEKQGGNFCG